jgi:hypothetical protein
VGSDQVEENIFLPARAAVSADEAKQLAETIAEQAPIDKEFVAALLRFDPIGTRTPPKLGALTPTDRYAPMLEGLSQLTQARETLTGFTDIYQFQLSEKDERTQLQEFKEEYPLEDIPGSKKLSTLVDRRQKQLADAATTKTTLVNANRLLKLGQFDECLNEIDKIPITNEDATLDEIDRIVTSAKFGRHWKPYRRRLGDPEGELKDLTRLLAATPFAKSTLQRQTIDEYKQRVSILTADIAVKQLHERDFTNVGQYASAARTLVESYADKTAQVVPKFKIWLSSRLARKRVPKYPRQLEEAVRKKKNELIFGKFTPQGVDRYQFFEWDQNARAFGTISITIYKAELIDDKPPCEPLDLTTIREFNRAYDKLHRDVFNKSRWQEFSNFCRNASQDLRGYQAVDPQNRGLTFEIEEEEAQAVLNVWDDVNFLSMRFSGSRSTVP